MTKHKKLILLLSSCKSNYNFFHSIVQHFFNHNKFTLHYLSKTKVLFKGKLLLLQQSYLCCLLLTDKLINNRRQVVYFSKTFFWHQTKKYFLCFCFSMLHYFIWESGDIYRRFSCRWSCKS